MSNLNDDKNYELFNESNSSINNSSLNNNSLSNLSSNELPLESPIKKRGHIKRKNKFLSEDNDDDNEHSCNNSSLNFPQVSKKYDEEKTPKVNQITSPQNKQTLENEEKIEVIVSDLDCFDDMEGTNEQPNEDDEGGGSVIIKKDEEDDSKQHIQSKTENNENNNHFPDNQYSTLFEITKSIRTQNSFIKLNNKLKLKLMNDLEQKTDSYLMALCGGMEQVSEDNIRPNVDVSSVIVEENSGINENESFIANRKLSMFNSPKYIINFKLKHKPSKSEIFNINDILKNIQEKIKEDMLNRQQSQSNILNIINNNVSNNSENPIEFNRCNSSSNENLGNSVVEQSFLSNSNNQNCSFFMNHKDSNDNYAEHILNSNPGKRHGIVNSFVFDSPAITCKNLFNQNCFRSNSRGSFEIFNLNVYERSHKSFFLSSSNLSYQLNSMKKGNKLTPHNQHYKYKSEIQKKSQSSIKSCASNNMNNTNGINSNNNSLVSYISSYQQRTIKEMKQELEGTVIIKRREKSFDLQKKINQLNNHNREKKESNLDKILDNLGLEIGSLLEHKIHKTEVGLNNYEIEMEALNNIKYPEDNMEYFQKAKEALNQHKNSSNEENNNFYCIHMEKNKTIENDSKLYKFKGLYTLDFKKNILFKLFSINNLLPEIIKFNDIKQCFKFNVQAKTFSKCEIKDYISDRFNIHGFS